MSEYGCVLLRLSSQTFRSEFHIIFRPTNILLLILFQPFKNVKAVFILWATREQTMSQTGPVICGLSTRHLKAT